MHSCFYTGYVWHRRQEPLRHAFRYRLYLAYLDLSEEAQIKLQCSWLFQGRYGPATVRVDDHQTAGTRLSELADHVGNYVQQQTGIQPHAIRLLTFVRNWGYYFAPLNLYYCFGQGGTELQAVVAEVSNIPWRESHYYLLECHREEQGSYRARHRKDFHVSPFMPMSCDYRWRWSDPGEQLRICLANTHADRPFLAQLRLQRLALTNRSLAGQIARQPCQSLQVVSAIYWQAFQLWMKQCPIYRHPRNA